MRRLGGLRLGRLGGLRLGRLGGLRRLRRRGRLRRGSRRRFGGGDRGRGGAGAFAFRRRRFLRRCLRRTFRPRHRRFRRRGALGRRPGRGCLRRLRRGPLRAGFLFVRRRRRVGVGQRHGQHRTEGQQDDGDGGDETPAPVEYCGGGVGVDGGAVFAAFMPRPPCARQNQAGGDGRSDGHSGQTTQSDGREETNGTGEDRQHGQRDFPQRRAGPFGAVAAVVAVTVGVRVPVHVLTTRAFPHRTAHCTTHGEAQHHSVRGNGHEKTPPTCGETGGGVHLRCPRWDSNPHWTGFESVASANWATGALQAAPVRPVAVVKQLEES